MGDIPAQVTAGALAKAMSELLGNADRRTELGRNGRAEWERRFRLDRYQQDMVGLMTTAGAENQVGER